ncbi:MAG: septum formation initiator family protein [Peptostreptococcaceae bacterium]|nr:septum formation initiator family protein [Peptostreptococcaceae bacterium]
MKGNKLKFNGYKIAAVIISVALCVTIIFSVKNIITLHNENSQLKEQNQELEDERDNLELELENVDTMEFIEEEARRQLKLANPDEILFILPEEKSEETDE